RVAGGPAEPLGHSSFVRAYAAVKVLSCIAVPAEHLEALGETLPDKPLHQLGANPDFLAVLAAVVVDVIDAEEGFFGFAAANARPPVIVKDSLLEPLLPVPLPGYALLAAQATGPDRLTANAAQSPNSACRSLRDTAIACLDGTVSASRLALNSRVLAFVAHPCDASCRPPSPLVFAFLVGISDRHNCNCAGHYLHEQASHEDHLREPNGAHRGLVRSHHGRQPFPGSRDLRCVVGRLTGDAGVQGGLVRAHRGSGGPVLPVEQDVLGVRGHHGQAAAEHSGVGLSLRSGPRPGHQRGKGTTG